MSDEITCFSLLLLSNLLLPISYFIYFRNFFLFFWEVKLCCVIPLLS
ncbi:unnamed protein product [Nyctereutes procyonoides]|uniref:(raccoon dog) hypothetical protein n=1 Tax=Nyctereutes procyonoides TaxID=34880 RepID=A0A811Y7H5_NYCPR|nr:unnamed protein product [Nyctereutes procyonoides]